MAHMPPPPPPPTSHRPTAPSQSLDHESDSDPDSDTDTTTPSALSPTTPRRRDSNEDVSERLIDELKSAVEGYPSFANYCCGGSIPISSTKHSPSFQDSSKAPVTSPPVTLRFDTPSGGVSKLSLPQAPEEEKGNERQKVEIEDLLAACTPDVAGDDKSSRGARAKGRRSSARLSKDKFAVDIHPADLGILDTIKQVLLPDLRLQNSDDGKGKGRSLWDGVGGESWREREEHWGVRADLCELSVYFSSSSNTQRPFETAPRRGTHFGTLIICLPSAHQGGGQLISHPSSSHPLSPSLPPSISPPKSKSPYSKNSTLLPTASLSPTLTWSVFPRTTSHSILPITCGHLVTLTYNLYTTEAVGSILQRYPIADPRLYPLYRLIRGLLGDQNFKNEGGTLAFHCTNNYHHTKKSTQHHMPYSLQGIDAVLFSVFRALGLKVMVAPVLGDEAWEEWAQIKEERVARKIYKDDKREESDEEMLDDSSDDEDGEEDLTRVGKGWWRLKMLSSDEGGILSVGGGDPTAFINKNYPLHPLPNVTWLNESSDRGWEVAMAHLKSTTSATPKSSPTKSQGKLKNPNIGSEEKVELMWQYSHAAIFVEIPTWGVGLRGSPGPIR